MMGDSMNNKGIVDKFLDGYDKHSNKETELRRIYVKPTKFRSGFGFVFSTIFFILLLTMFSFNLVYFLLLFGSLGIAIYYGINLFTEKGIGLPRTVEVPVEYGEKEQKEEIDPTKKSGRYKVQ